MVCTMVNLWRASIWLMVTMVSDDLAWTFTMVKSTSTYTSRCGMVNSSLLVVDMCVDVGIQQLKVKNCQRPQVQFRGFDVTRFPVIGLVFVPSFQTVIHGRYGCHGWYHQLVSFNYSSHYSPLISNPIINYQQPLLNMSNHYQPQSTVCNHS